MDWCLKSIVNSSDFTEEWRIREGCAGNFLDGLSEFLGGSSAIHWFDGCEILLESWIESRFRPWLKKYSGSKVEKFGMMCPSGHESHAMKTSKFTESRSHLH